MRGVTAAAPGRRVRRPTKLQVAALAIVTVLSFGPVAALFLVISRDEGPGVELLDEEAPPPDCAQLTVTLIGVAPALGELRARVVVQPQEGLQEDGRLSVDLVLRVNDVRGRDTYVFPAGEPLQPVEGNLALAGGSETRYPFDRYDAGLTTALATDTGADAEPVVFGLDILSNVDEFDVTATPASLDTLGQPAATPDPAPLALVEFGLTRQRTTTVYAVWTMALMWALAIMGVLIVWAIVIWQVEVPWWSLGYFVGVLFALPQLRELLPGRPAPGTLLDYVAFYWSIAIVGVSLIAVLAIWIQRTRPVPACEADDESE